MDLLGLDLPLCICLPLEDNIKLYYIFRILEKRADLPMLYNSLLHIVSINPHPGVAARGA